MSNRSLSWALTAKLVDDQTGPLLKLARQNERVKDQVVKAETAKAAAHREAAAKISGSIKTVGRSLDASGRDAASAGRDFRQLSLAEQKAAVQSEKLAAEHLKLSTRTAKLGRDLDSARVKAQHHEQQLDRSGRASSRAATGLGTLAKRALAVGAAYVSIQGIRDSISVTEDLTKATMGLAGNFGMATDEGSRWAAQLKVRGIETKQFNTSLNTLSRNITAVGDADAKRAKDLAKLARGEKQRVDGLSATAKASDNAGKYEAKRGELTRKSLGSQADAFNKLGISTKEVKAGKSDLYGFLFEVADGMEGMTSKTERNAVGLKLFGKQWQVLRPLLASGSQGLQEQLAMADKYGLTLEETSTKGLADQIAAQREWKFALLGVQATLGGALIPVMTEAAKKGAELTAKVRENWPEIKQEITPVIDAIEGVVVPMGKFVGQHPELLKVAAAALAVGAAVKTIRFAGQITGATTLLTTFGRLRRAAAVVPEVEAGAGAAKAGEAKRTLGSRAAGAVTSPWTAAAAVAVAAPIIAGKARNGKIVEQAAREFADEIAQRTRTGIKSGLRKPEASQLGQAQASADQARTKLQNLDQTRGGRPLSMFNDSFRKEYADAERQAREASPKIVAAFAAGLKTKRFVDSRSLMDQFRVAFSGMPRVAQTTGAGAMVQMARSMEREGRAPKGTVDRLLRDLKTQWGGLVPVTRDAGVKSTRELDRALSDRKLVAHAGDTVRKLGDQFGQLPRLAVKSVPGAVATLGAQLDELERIAKDRDAPAVMQAQARRALPGLREEYSRTLSRLAARMGMSRDDARAWADAQVAAARRAGKGRADVDSLTVGVSALRTKMRGGVIDADDYRRALQRIRDSGMSTLQSEMPQIPDAKGGKQGATGKKKRRGGLISRFAGGGHVDTLMSGGEEYLPPEVASRYPAGVLDSIAQIQAPHFARGGPVGRRPRRYSLGGMIVPGPSDRDGTYVPAEDGGFVLTGHGRALRDEMLGFRRGGALQRFAGGGVVRGKVSVFGPPLEAAGTTANGMSSGQAGIALNIKPGTDAGWNNATTNRWVQARQRFLVRIAGHQAVLPMIDKGPAGKTGRAIDVTGAGARAMGLNPATFPTDRQGTAQAVGKDGKASSSESVIPEKVIVRRNVGKSETRGGLLEDPYGIGFDAVGLWGSRSTARKLGGLGTPAIREALDAQKDSYTREIQSAREEARTGKGRRASGKLGKSSPGGTWLRPVGGTQSGSFGESRPGHMHAGVDLAVPIGTPVRATRPGRSLGPQSNPGGYGTYTSIQHGGGYLSLYGHMSSVAARAGQSVGRGQTIGRSGNTGRSSGPHVHFEVRRGGSPVNPIGLLGRAYRGGGRVSRFARGGVVQRFAPGGKVARPTKAMRTTLKSVRSSTSDANLDAFGEAIEVAGLQRLEALRRALLREVRAGGDRQAIGRLQAAISTIEVDIAGRIGERIQSATKSAAGWQAKRGKWEHAMAMEGVDMSSATGLQRTITTGQTYLENEAPGERDDLVTARNRIKRELAQADTPAKRERLKTELDSTNGKIDDLDTQVRATRVEVESAKRALPQQQAAERVSKIDLSAAFAELTNSLDDDVAAAEALRSEYQRQLNDPALAKTPEAIAAAARGLRSASDSLRDLGRRQVDDRLDAEDALAKLTDDQGADDRVVALRREKFLNDRLEEAKANPDPNYADIASIGSALLAVRDGLKSLDTTMQEQQARDDALADLLKQQVENQQKLLNGAAISRDAIASAIAAAANGWIGQTVTRGAATPSFSGNGVIS